MDGKTPVAIAVTPGETSVNHVSQRCEASCRPKSSSFSSPWTHAGSLRTHTGPCLRSLSSAFLLRLRRHKCANRPARGTKLAIGRHRAGEARPRPRLTSAPSWSKRTFQSATASDEKWDFLAKLFSAGATFVSANSMFRLRRPRAPRDMRGHAHRRIGRDCVPTGQARPKPCHRVPP